MGKTSLNRINPDLQKVSNVWKKIGLKGPFMMEKILHAIGN